ncbi:MAG TPA: DUF2142 domain-containing protein [Anaerolineaceae bacterium]|nr:DUF2142 domain-containing protein [Anaerolineaceae bacterium]
MGKRLLKPANLLLIIGIIFGVVFAVFTPFGTGFDEEHHLARVYDISGLHMLPNRSIYDKTVYFDEFHLLSYWRRFYRDEGFEQFKPESFLMRGDYDSMEIKSTMSVYPPVMFFPQAVVAGIAWRFLDLPIIPVTMVMRVVGLLVYLMGCYLALKVLPVGQWGFLVLALSPTAVYQAATLNADGYSFAAGFIFMALVLAAALKPDVKLTRRYLLYLCLAIAALGLGKPATVFLLPLLLLLPRSVFTKRGQAAWLWGISIAAVLFHFGWLYIGFKNSRVGQEIFADTAGSLSTQLLDYLGAFFRSFVLHAGQLFSSMAAGYGNWEGKVPALVFVFFTAAALLSLLMDARQPKLSKWMRLFMAAVMLFCWAGALVLLTAGKFSSGSTDSFLIAQGRYLLPTLPLLVFALSGLFTAGDKTRRLLQRAIPAGVVITLALFFWGLYAHFYTSCGPSLFTGQNCQLPAYHNLETSTPPEVTLKEGVLLEQRFTNTCRRLLAVEVLVDDGAAKATGSVELALRTQQGGEVARKEVEASELTALKRLVLNVPQGTELAKGGYSITLRANGLTGTAAFAVRTPDRYPGAFTRAGSPFDGDLVFYYYCAPAGLFGY